MQAEIDCLNSKKHQINNKLHNSNKGCKKDK